eukprot:5344999-Pleurochrysis_carterae.AAC.2
MDALMQARAESIAALSSTNANELAINSGHSTAQLIATCAHTNVPTRSARAHNEHVEPPCAERVNSEASHPADAHIAESLAPVTAELDSIRAQLTSLLAAPPTVEQRVAHAGQREGELDSSDPAKPHAPRPNQLSLCALASIFLNVAALGAAAAIGAKQLWGRGAYEPMPLSCSFGLFATVSFLYLFAQTLQPIQRPHVPAQRLQATEHPRAAVRRPCRARPTYRLLLSLALVMC